MSGRSLEVPGSLSSPLARMYLGLLRILGNEAPLHSGGETCAAAAAQSRFFNFVDDLIGRHLLQGFFERLIAIVSHVDVDFVRICGFRNAG